MKSLLVGVILGLLAAVHSTPVNTVTLARAESDVLQEAMEDEFLILSPTTQKPKRIPSIQMSQKPSTDFRRSETIESSDDHYATATQSVSKALSATLTTRDTSDSTSDPFSSQGYESTEMTREKMTDYPDSTSDFGSGDEATTVQYPATITNMTSSPRKVASVVLLTSTAPPVTTGMEDSYSGSGMSQDFTESTPTANANTQNILMAHMYSTSSSGVGQTLGRYPTTGSSMSSTTRQEASDVLSTSMAPTTTTGGENSDSGSGMYGGFTELTTSTKTTTYTVSTRQPHSSPSSDVKSGRGAILNHYPATVSSMTSSPGTEATSAASAAPPEMAITESKVSVKKSNFAMASIEFENGIHKDKRHGGEESAQHKEQRTPGWIVILSCIVGVAVLVIVCVAIVTRERWHGPNQVSQLQTKTSQQKEVEMETFLQKDEPRDNGKTEEYTVIPLDELPWSYESH